MSHLLNIDNNLMFWSIILFVHLFPVHGDKAKFLNFFILSHTGSRKLCDLNFMDMQTGFKTAV